MREKVCWRLAKKGAVSPSCLEVLQEKTEKRGQETINPACQSLRRFNKEPPLKRPWA